MRAGLSNFIGVRKRGLPVLSVPIVDGRFVFQIKHTTESYDVRAEGVIDISTNALVLILPDDVPFDYDTPSLDQHVIKQALDDLRPHVELYCPNKKCKYHYHLSSYIFDIKKHPQVNSWIIGPLKLFLESFKTGHLNVQNDWRRGETNIYSLTNEDAEPITYPIIDFEEMGKDKLLTRIQTLVTFS